MMQAFGIDRLNISSSLFPDRELRIVSSDNPLAGGGPMVLMLQIPIGDSFPNTKLREKAGTGTVEVIESLNHFPSPFSNQTRSATSFSLQAFG